MKDQTKIFVTLTGGDGSRLTVDGDLSLFRQFTKMLGERPGRRLLKNGNPSTNKMEAVANDCRS